MDFIVSISSFNQPFSIELKPSRAKLSLIVLIHLAIGIVLLVAMTLSNFNGFIFAVSLFCIVISCVYSICLHIKLNLKKSILAINDDLNKDWKITLKDNHFKNVTLSPASFISNYIILLNFRDILEKSDYTSVITPYCVSKDDFRRLKVLVKTNKSEEVIRVRAK